MKPRWVEARPQPALQRDANWWAPLQALRQVRQPSAPQLGGAAAEVFLRVPLARWPLYQTASQQETMAQSRAKVRHSQAALQPRLVASGSAPANSEQRSQAPPLTAAAQAPSHQSRFHRAEPKRSSRALVHPKQPQRMHPLQPFRWSWERRYSVQQPSPSGAAVLKPAVAVRAVRWRLIRHWEGSRAAEWDARLAPHQPAALPT